MILVDSSVWVDHLRRTDRRMAALLDAGRVLCHPFVIGEIALGSLAHRARTLALLRSLPQAPIANDAETVAFIERRRIYSLGIGYVDAHLLAAAVLALATLWTRDKRLHVVALQLGLAAAI